MIAPSMSASSMIAPITPARAAKAFCPCAAPRALETKRAGLRLDGLDAAGVFEGYASLFDVVDLGGDVVAPGAFAASLRRTGAGGVRMLWQHEQDQPIGAWLSLGEDARGLKARGRINLEVARGREAYALLAQGAIDGLSIGYRTRRAAKDARTSARRLLELDLVEISIVTFPMLPQARVSAVAAKGAQNWRAAAHRFERALARQIR